MKRFYFIAAMAILAAGCQKTEIQNEVQTPIGFSTEVGKQTRAIVQDRNYLDGTVDGTKMQPFAVYAYSHQTISNADGSTTENDETVMNNVEIIYQSRTASDGSTTKVWAAAGDTKYYWPNSPLTTIDFYAYSPAVVTNPNETPENHQKMNVAPTCDDGDGLTLTGYEHTNMYVDFMVGTPVIGAKFSDQNGSVSGTPSQVPVDFHHKFAQINFTVKIADNETYPGVDFEVESITLNGIVNEATYTYTDENPNNKVAGWTPVTTAGTYPVYPATTTGDNNAPALVNADTGTTEVNVILETDAVTPATKTNPGRTFSTTPVTMIPQTLQNQSFTIVYNVSGKGVADEQVTKTFKFSDVSTTVPAWGINQNIRYTLSIKLNEITFTTSVTGWDSETGASYEINDDSNGSN